MTYQDQASSQLQPNSCLAALPVFLPPLVEGRETKASGRLSVSSQLQTGQDSSLHPLARLLT